MVKADFSLRLSLQERATAHLARAAIAVVGVWDPLLAQHRAVLASLVTEARTRKLLPLAIVLDPHPAAIAHGPCWWPVYCDARTRVRLLRDCGVSVARMQLSREALQASAADFLDAVGATIKLAELWLGAFQRIGTGPDSSAARVHALASERDIRIRRLPESDVDAQANAVRRLLAEGRIAEATLLAGYPLARARPADGSEPTAWAPGRYRALSHRGAIAVTVQQLASGERTLVWPDAHAESLTFVAGPRDTPMEESFNEQ